MKSNMKCFQVYPIGTIRRHGDRIEVQLDAPYRAGLKALNTFSHVIVHWWAQHFDEPQHRDVLVTPLPYVEGREAGVFASRSPERPNLIMTTVCKILEVDEVNGVVRIQNIDAFDGTPVLDLKAYFPVVDRVKEAHISPYLVGWPEWLPDEGIGLMPEEAQSSAAGSSSVAR